MTIRIMVKTEMRMCNINEIKYAGWKKTSPIMRQKMAYFIITIILLALWEHYKFIVIYSNTIFNIASTNALFYDKT